MATTSHHLTVEATTVTQEAREALYSFGRSCDRLNSTGVGTPLKRRTNKQVLVLVLVLV